MSENQIVGNSVVASPIETTVKSRTEEVRDDVLKEFSKIIKANGYRNDVQRVIAAIRPVDKIREFPEIGVVFGTERINIVDGSGNVFDKEIEVWVQAAFECDKDAGEWSQNLQQMADSIKWDVEKCLCGIMTTYINSANRRWNVKFQPFEVTPVIDLGEHMNKGVIITAFTVHIRYMGTDLG